MRDHRDHIDKVSDKSASVPCNLSARYFVQIYIFHRDEKNTQTTDRSLDRRASIFDGTGPPSFAFLVSLKWLSKNGTVISPSCTFSNWREI